MNGRSTWIGRFEGLSDPVTIRARTYKPAKAVDLSGREMPEVACDLLEDAFKAIFYPTTRDVEILAILAERALSYARQNYVDEHAFLQRCYSREVQIQEVAPLCITGPAGTGKTQLCEAFTRLLPSDSMIEVTGHGSFPLIASRFVSVKARQNLSEILFKPLVKPGGVSTRRGGSVLLEECQQWQYQCGVCSVGLDELQFLSQSNSANAMLAKILLTLGYLGIPSYFNANYSVIRKLIRRPPEETQRFLSRPAILLPDAYDSPDWAAVLAEFEKIAPGIFLFSFYKQSRNLWSMCAGIKRELVRLLVLAYRQVRRSNLHTVSTDDVSQAYHSPEFYIQRRDVEALFTFGINGPNSASDLCCPLPIPPDHAKKYQMALEDARQQKVASAALLASLNREERQGIEMIVSAAKTGTAVTKKGNILKMPRRQKSTLESLKNAGRKFEEDL